MRRTLQGQKPYKGLLVVIIHIINRLSYGFREKELSFSIEEKGLYEDKTYRSFLYNLRQVN